MMVAAAAHSVASCQLPRAGFRPVASRARVAAALPRGRRSSSSSSSSSRRPGRAQRRAAAPRAAAGEDEEVEVPLEEDFSALSNDVERLAQECDIKLDGVSLFLVGMMGCGKSTVGQLLAKMLGYCFFDSDALIEQLAQKDIPTIFAEDGEEAFREIETQVLAELGAYKRCVIATGGGAVTTRKNWSYLQNGVVTYLQAPSELLATRVLADGTAGRPMLEGAGDEMGATLEKINGLMETRAELYERADMAVSLEGGAMDAATGAPPAVVVHRILTRLKAKLDEKIAMDDDAARKDFEINDQGPIPVTGPMPKPSTGN